jgi:hypothetical protein
MAYLAAALILIYVLHLIDKHNRWKIAVKITAYVVATAAILIGGFIGWSAYEAHKEDQRRAQAKAVEDAEHKKAVEACVERLNKAEGRADIFTEAICDQDPNSTPQAQAIDLSAGFVPQANAQKRVVKATQLRATNSTDLTTTEWGHLGCGHVDTGEVVTLLVAHDIFIRIKTSQGQAGWAMASSFEVVH